MEIRFEPGTFWRSVGERSDSARQGGALRPISTRSELVEDGGIRFVVRVVESLQEKGLDSAMQRTAAGSPFLPYDEELFVADVSETHLALLNKFPVVEHHVLLVTRKFEEQKSLLSRRDFEAVCACLAERDALVFYNAGVEAGASQRHKHLQLVPVPLGPGPERMPSEPLLSRARYQDAIGSSGELPFLHAIAEIAHLLDASLQQAAVSLRERYLELLAKVGREDDPRAYNLLLTRDTMFVVPRSRERWEGVSVNALGFAGALLARSEEDLGKIRRAGPMEILRHVALPR